MGAGLGVSGAALAILLSVLLAEAHALTAQGIIDRRGACGERPPPSSARPSGRRRLPVRPADAPKPDRRRGSRRASRCPQPTSAEQRRERRTLATDLLSALIALALLAILQNFDVVLLGREAPGNAGSYAPISVACKPLVLAAFVLAGFLLPGSGRPTPRRPARAAPARRGAGRHRRAGCWC